MKLKSFLIGVGIVIVLWLLYVLFKGATVSPIEASDHTRWVNQGSEYYVYGTCVPTRDCGTTEGTQTKVKKQNQKCQDVEDASHPDVCVKDTTQTITIRTYDPVSCTVPLVDCKVDTTPVVEAPCTSNCGTPPTFAPSSTEPPKCGVGDVSKAVVNPHVYRKGDVAIVKWWNTAGDKAHIYYKQVNSPTWQYSVVVDNTGMAEIKGLGTMDISFAVMQVDSCSGGVSVNAKVIVDGNTDGWILFR
jgi:hypothetical protein